MDDNKRLIEIDFFRGAALLLIFWDHLINFLFVGYPLHYGYSDSAETFVFLSGYISGRVYSKILLTKGFAAGQRKAFNRAFQIYGAYLLAICAILFFGYLTPRLHSTDPMHIFVGAFEKDPLNAAISILSLKYFPPLFDILPLYVLLIPAGPLIVMLTQKSWRASLWITMAIYCAVQFYPEVGPQSSFPSWVFNPLAWLFLFTLGIILSIKSQEGVLRVRIHPVYLILAVVFLLYAFVDRKVVIDDLRDIGLMTKNSEVFFLNPPLFVSKENLQPLLLAHFFCLVYVVYALSPFLEEFWKSRYSKAFARCGQHSLVLFSVGIVLDYLFAYIIIYLGVTPALFYQFAILGCLTTLLLGYLLTAVHPDGKNALIQFSTATLAQVLHKQVWHGIRRPLHRG